MSEDKYEDRELRDKQERRARKSSYAESARLNRKTARRRQSKANERKQGGSGR